MDKVVLKLVGTVSVPAATIRFVTSEKFVRTDDRKALVKIRHINDNFVRWFLSKVEDPIGETTLSCHEPLGSSVHASVIAELGGEEKAETTLQEVYALMAHQSSEEGNKKGYSTTSFRSNVFYVRDVNGALRAVHAYLFYSGWAVDARPIEADAPCGNFQVFSRN